jgi:hypothetical protein
MLGHVWAWQLLLSHHLLHQHLLQLVMSLREQQLVLAQLTRRHRLMQVSTLICSFCHLAPLHNAQQSRLVVLYDSIQQLVYQNGTVVHMDLGSQYIKILVTR